MANRHPVIVQREPFFKGSTQSQQSGNGDTSLVFSHTTTLSAYPNNHLIFVVIGQSFTTEGIASVDYGPVSLTLSTSQTVEMGLTDVIQGIWVGVLGANVGTQNVTITFTGSMLGTRVRAVAFDIEGCSVAVSDAAAVASQTTTGTSISNNITTVTSKAFLFDIVTSDGTGSTEHVMGPQQTQIGSWVDTIQDFETSISYRRTTTFGLQTMSRTWTTSDNNGQIVFAVRPM